MPGCLSVAAPSRCQSLSPLHPPPPPPVNARLLHASRCPPTPSSSPRMRRPPQWKPAATPARTRPNTMGVGWATPAGCVSVATAQRHTTSLSQRVPPLRPGAAATATPAGCRAQRSMLRTEAFCGSGSGCARVPPHLLPAMPSPLSSTHSSPLFSLAPLHRCSRAHPSAKLLRLSEVHCVVAAPVPHTHTHRQRHTQHHNL